MKKKKAQDEQHQKSPIMPPFRVNSCEHFAVYSFNLFIPCICIQMYMCIFMEHTMCIAF